jgi:hypothetical protein
MRAENTVRNSVQRRVKELNVRGSIPGTGKRFSLPYTVQTDFETHPSSYPMGIGALSLEIKRLVRESDH